MAAVISPAATALSCPVFAQRSWREIALLGATSFQDRGGRRAAGEWAVGWGGAGWG